MAWRGSPARGAFRAPAFIAFSRGAPSPAIARRRPGPTGPCPDAFDLGRSYPPGNRNVRLSRRRLSQTMGATALCRGSLEPSPRAPGDGREPLACAPSRRAQPREDARRNHRHRQGHRNVGNGHEPDRHHRGRAGLCFRRRRTRELRNHRHSRRAFSQSVRGAGAGPAGGVSVLRLHQRPAWRVGSSCVTIMAPIKRPAISRARSNVWASKLRHPSCANPRAMASPSASSEP